jgi:hypothetical protein
MARFPRHARRAAGPWVRTLPVLLAAAALGLAAPRAAMALQLGGSLSWDLGRTEIDSPSSDVAQTTFGQGYQVHMSGAAPRRRLFTWRAGASWRDNQTRFSGTNQTDTDVTLTNLNVGMVLAPATMPVNVDLRRSIVESDGAVTSQRTLGTTVSLSTRVPMYDGNPLGVSAFQSTQDAGAGTTTSRLMSLSKRFDLGSRTQLNGSYQFSRFDSRGADVTGHGVSLSTQTRWSRRLSSSAYANMTSRSTSTPLRVEGRTLLLNNNAGASLAYRRDRSLSANLQYAYTQQPQDLRADLQSHMLSGRASLRVDTKTDLRGRFTARRLDLSDTQLDTLSAYVNVTHRPRFGWSTGGQLGVSGNRTTGLNDVQRNNYSGRVFLNARHEFVPAEINWGVNTAYSASRGDFIEDRLTNNAHVSATERRLRKIRLVARYRFTDIQESEGGRALDPFSQEHSLGVTGTMVPRRGLWRPSDSLSASFEAGRSWSRYYREARHLANTSAGADMTYLTGTGITARGSYNVQDNRADEVGAIQILRASLGWTQRVVRRGQLHLHTDTRRSWRGGGFTSQEVTAGASFDYAVGLLRVSLSSEFTFVDLAGSDSGSDTTNIRMNVTRVF